MQVQNFEPRRTALGVHFGVFSKFRFNILNRCIPAPTALLQESARFPVQNFEPNRSLMHSVQTLHTTEGKPLQSGVSALFSSIFSTLAQHLHYTVGKSEQKFFFKNSRKMKKVVDKVRKIR